MKDRAGSYHWKESGAVGLFGIAISAVFLHWQLGSVVTS